MELVIDANILISGIITPGRVRRTLLDKRIKPHAPLKIIQETINHADKISKYTGIPVEILKPILQQALPKWITTHNEEEIPEEIRMKAKEIAGRFDPDDWPFIALAMFLNIPLWTGDKGILEQAAKTGFKHFTAIDTEGVEMLLNGEPLERVKEKIREKYGSQI